MLNLVILQGRFPSSDKFTFEYKPSDGEKKSYFKGFLSVEQNYKKQNAKYADSDIFEIRAFGSSADMIGKHFKPGDNILVRGELTKPEPYEDNEHKKVYPPIHVTVREIQFTRGNERRDTSESNAAPAPSTSTQPSTGNPFNNGGGNVQKFNVSGGAQPTGKYSFFQQK